MSNCANQLRHAEGEPWGPVLTLTLSAAKGKGKDGAVAGECLRTRIFCLTVEEDESKNESHEIYPEVKTYCSLQVAIEAYVRNWQTIQSSNH